jgi:hypothetical protein
MVRPSYWRLLPAGAGPASQQSFAVINLLKIKEAIIFHEQTQCDMMYVSDEDAAVIYARACRAWYGKRAAGVVKKRIEELRRAGDIKGVVAWSQVADKLSQLRGRN